MEQIAYGLLIIMMFLMGALAVFIIYTAIDVLSLPRYITDGTVKDITFRKGYETVQYCGAVNGPIPVYVEDAWTCTLETLHGTGVVMLYKDPSKWMKAGVQVSALYSVGRLSKEFRVLDVQPYNT